ncbi:MAG: hypothetical protein AAF909_03755 [Pseudomonadota bacterium]
MRIFTGGGAPDATQQAGQAAQEGAELARWRAGGVGRFSNIVALVALMFSGWSFYETVWKADALRMFVAPQIQYADNSRGVFDAYEVPITIANVGARAGVVLSFEMTVENPRTGETKEYYSAEMGTIKQSFSDETTRFAPLSVGGREAATAQILFYPKSGETVDRLVEIEAGEYRFTVTMNAAPVERLPIGEPSEEAGRHSVSFVMAIDGVDYRAFNNGGSLPMRTLDHRAVVSE